MSGQHFTLGIKIVVIFKRFFFSDKLVIGAFLN